MSNPLVSVVIGTYNREALIARTLHSVFDQTYSPIEIIVVDDACTDGTVEVIKDLDTGVQLIRRRENSNSCSVPRNRGIKSAKGAFIFGRLFCSPFRTLFYSYQFRDGPRRLLDEVGLFIEDPAYRGKEDYDFLLRVAGHHSIGFIDECLTAYRKSSAGMSHVDAAWRSQPEDVPFHYGVLKRPALWEGRVPYKLVRDIFVRACQRNAQHWRDRCRYGRAIYFALWGLSKDITNKDSYVYLFKSAIKSRF